ncbi:MAG TPA: hypothetical protein VEI03_22065 [Stellaceae bacterium]|nr:hypothetical protein [Stellaceae bacterium]
MSNDLPGDLRPVVDFFSLPDTAVVEKDWYVVKALAAIASIDPAPLGLVFGGARLWRAPTASFAACRKISVRRDGAGGRS